MGTMSWCWRPPGVSEILGVGYSWVLGLCSRDCRYRVGFSREINFSEKSKGSRMEPYLSPH